MKIYRNGDRCPCCGLPLQGKDADWLLAFSELVDMLRLPPWEDPPEPIRTPEDAMALAREHWTHQLQTGGEDNAETDP